MDSALYGIEICLIEMYAAVIYMAIVKDTSESEFPRFYLFKKLFVAKLAYCYYRFVYSYTYVCGIYVCICLVGMVEYTDTKYKLSSRNIYRYSIYIHT